MAQRITEDEVRHVAKLARLSLTSEQVAQFTHQLGDILDYVAQLDELDVSGVEPMAHSLDLSGALREDTPGEPLSPDAALANAPGRDGGFFAVPKVLGEGPSA